MPSDPCDPYAITTTTTLLALHFQTGLNAKVINGALAGAVAAFATYPNDTVRRLCQLDSTAPGKTRQYRNAIDA